MYGLKQAPKAQYNRVDSYFMKQGFKRSDSEPTLNKKKNETKMYIIISFYVNDLLIIGKDAKYLKKFKMDMSTRFEMLYL